MDKKNMKDVLGKAIGKMRFLQMSDPDLDDDIEVEEEELSDGEDGGYRDPEDEMKARFAKQKKVKLAIHLFFTVLIVSLVLSFFFYNRNHTFRDYVIRTSYPNEVAAGTKYESVGKYIYRYNSDGVSCVTRKNELKWSITYNMQAPIADVCGDMMVVAEQQGNKIYVVNKDGLVGNFETVLPILKVRVSKQGLVAAVLEDEIVTWVNLYQANGDPIASDKTTIGESGYPLDIDVSPDGQKLAVSYIGVAEGILHSNVVFYHFGKAGQKKENHIVANTEYQETVIPQIYFTDNARAIAVSDDGFIVYEGTEEPEETKRVTFDREIISTFFDEETIGFLFDSEDIEHDYHMELYNYNGKRKVSKNINATFDTIRIQNDQIIMNDSDEITIFTKKGVERFSSRYEKNVSAVFYFSEFRKYMVITSDSFDKIRITSLS